MKMKLYVIMLISVLSLAGCGKSEGNGTTVLDKNTPPATNVETDGAPIESTQPAETEQSEEEFESEQEELNYLDALTDTDIDNAKQIAEQFYSTAIKKAKELKLAEEKNYSPYIEQYKPGEIVIFQGEDENSTRYIALGLKDNQWEVIDEGY